jgi:hypothetical protein
VKTTSRAETASRGIDHLRITYGMRTSGESGVALLRVGRYVNLDYRGVLRRVATIATLDWPLNSRGLVTDAESIGVWPAVNLRGAVPEPDALPFRAICARKVLGIALLCQAPGSTLKSSCAASCVTCRET